MVVESFTEHNTWLSISFCKTNLTSKQWLVIASFLRFFSWNALILGQCTLGGGGGARGWGGWWNKLKQRRKKTQIVGFRVGMTLHAPTKDQYSTIYKAYTDGH